MENNNFKAKCLLFGLNYSYCKEGKLKGCINDVKNISELMKLFLGNDTQINIYTDDYDRKSTSYVGIIQKLYKLAIDSWSNNLDFVWIHYSGHGSQQKDLSNDPDEIDGMDEGLVPSDYETMGILIDDILNDILKSFNPKTKILFICDSCHSGSILDLLYMWDTKNKKYTLDNKNCSIKSPTILISGCMDQQTSADAYNLLGDYKSIGALTASVVKILKNNPDIINNIFTFVELIKSELVKGNFSQYPCLSSNYDLNNNETIIPYNNFKKQNTFYKEDSYSAPSNYYDKPSSNTTTTTPSHTYDIYNKYNNYYGYKRELPKNYYEAHNTYADTYKKKQYVIYNNPIYGRSILEQVYQPQTMRQGTYYHPPLYQNNIIYRQAYC